jgi:hypothetical protein
MLSGYFSACSKVSGCPQLSFSVLWLNPGLLWFLSPLSSYMVCFPWCTCLNKNQGIRSVSFRGVIFITQATYPSPRNSSTKFLLNNSQNIFKTENWSVLKLKCSTRNPIIGRVKNYTNIAAIQENFETFCHLLIALTKSTPHKCIGS